MTDNVRGVSVDVYRAIARGEDMPTSSPPSDSAALPETRVEEIREATEAVSQMAEQLRMAESAALDSDDAYAPQRAEDAGRTATKLENVLALLADRDRLQRRVEELEEQVQRVATVAQAFGEGRRHMDGLERCGEIARAALISETPHAK